MHWSFIARRFAVWFSCLLLVATGPAWPQAQIDGIQASASRVLVGEPVSFGISWSISGSFQNGGSSNLVEPAPTEGMQEWMLNWYWTDATTALGIDLQAGGQSYNERFNLSEGSGSSGSWGFVMTFDSPGLVTIGASGSWATMQTATSQGEMGTRHCYNTGDPELGVYLTCDSWSYSYPFSQSQSEIGGLLNAVSVQVEVVAVPEPGAWALWLAGLGVVGWASARSHRRCG